MKRMKISRLVTIAFITCLIPSGSGCGTQMKWAPVETQVYRDAKGYAIEVEETKAGSFETPPYIPEKIRFELLNRLRQKGLVPSQLKSERLLVVIIETEALYPALAKDERYSELASHVRLVDTKNKETIAKAEISTLNAFGPWTSDFAESTHAEQIAVFLEGVVR
ncbi:MAG TPA: hypothetical protein VMW90_01195 [Acidobacteriota bacterium]|nr:hypothetical protein [Acidobacteriota bacterium]